MSRGEDEQPVEAAAVDAETTTTTIERTTTTERSTTTTTTTTTTIPTTTAPPLTRDQCTEMPPEGIFAKDSGATQGRCLHFYASVFQFDANTGPCSFLGYYGSAPHQYSYEFSDGIISVRADPSQCPKMGPIVADDIVEVWAVNKGIESYDTTIGGTNTYTVFEVVDIVKLRSGS